MIFTHARTWYRYNLSGVHLDDYYYPHTTRDIIPDDHLYQVYVSGSGALSKDEWRRESLRHYVTRLHRRLTSERPGLKVSFNTLGLYTYPSDDDVTDMSDTYVTQSSPFWPTTSYSIGDFLTPMLSWLPTDEDGYGKVKPMLIDRR